MKRYVRAVLCACAMTCASVNLLVAQSAPEKPKLPTIIPPSPDAASLGKYGDIQVGSYTGIPSINIPLHTVQVRDASVSINLGYHAGGIKVEEEASWVGLGWSLNAGGAITRSVRGFDDLLNGLQAKGYVYSRALPAVLPSGEAVNVADYGVFLNDMCMKTIDAEPDIFMFNFGGMSGKFFLKKKTGSRIEVDLLSNNEKIKIDFDETTKKWTVWGKDGTKYLFGTTETTQSWGVTAVNNVETPQPPDMADETQVPFISTWYLDKITSPTGEEINFSYDKSANAKSYTSRTTTNWSESRTYCLGITGVVATTATDCTSMGTVNAVYDGKFAMIGPKPGYESFIDFKCLEGANAAWINGPSSWCTPTNISSGSLQSYKLAYLKSISFKNGKVTFVRSEREDIQVAPDPSGASDTYSSPEKLDQIIVERFDNSGYIQTKKIQFTYAYFTTGGTTSFLGKRLKLLSVQELNNSSAVPPHTFTYDPTSLPAKNSKSRDHWGFYNQIDNSTLIPTVRYKLHEAFQNQFNGASRDASEAGTKAASLTKVTYPTRGYTQFTYELNTFNSDQTSESKPVRHFSFDVSSGDVSNDSTLTGRVFQLKEQAAVTINMELKCLGLACHPYGTAPLLGFRCREAAELSVVERYIEVLNLGSNAIVAKGVTQEFLCAIDESKCSFYSGVSGNACGITKTITIILPAGTYFIKATPLNGFSARALVNYDQHETVTSFTTTLIRKGGGLRVSKMLVHDGHSTTNDQVTSYKYETTDASGLIRSTGKLMTFPKYAFGQFTVTPDAENSNIKIVGAKLFSSSSSNVPLGSSAQGNAVGYDRVEEIHGVFGQNGKIVRYYKNEPEVEVYPYIPNTATITHSASNGLLTKEEIWNADEQKVKETENNYEHIFGTPVEGLTIINQSGRCYDDVTRQEEMFFVHSRYTEQAEWWFMTSSKETLYDITNPSKPVTFFKTNTFQYNSDHKQVISIESTSSDGRSLKTTMSYPLDATDVAPAEMWNATSEHYKHRHSDLVKSETFINNIKTGGFINNYEYQDGLVNKTKVSILEGDSYEDGFVFKADSRGNIVEMHKKDDVVTSFIWGFGGTLPIAKVTNAAHDEVLTALPSSAKNKLAEGYMTEQDIIDAVSSIYDILPDAQIVFYTYTSDGLVTSIYNENLIMKKFEYDDLKRLRTVFDNDLKPVLKYKYYYKGN